MGVKFNGSKPDRVCHSFLGETLKVLSQMDGTVEVHLLDAFGAGILSASNSTSIA